MATQLSTSNPFALFKGHQVRVVKRDGYSRYGTLEGIEKDYILLRYPDGKSEVVACDQVASMADTHAQHISLKPPHFSHQELGHSHAAEDKKPEGQQLWARMLYIMIGGGMVIASLTILFEATAVLARSLLPIQAIIMSIVAALALGMAACGFYIIITE